LDSAAKISNAIVKGFRDGGKLMVCGNGASATDAQHIVTELMTRQRFDRDPLAAIALTPDAAVLTAIANDYGFDHMFERQLRAIGRAGDCLLAISTSGKSSNVLAALRAARELGIVTLGFTGERGQQLADLCRHCLVAPSSDTHHTQEIFLVAAHAIIELVEQDIFGAA
jgi:D-sedoheptulose 7-phosphate isomerase